MAREINKTTLSKSVLEMKFMKKSKLEIGNHGDERLLLYQNLEKRDLILGNCVFEPSFVVCEGLAVGRLSFKGMNPEIERLMELEKDPFAREVVTKEEQQEVDVTDEQMAEHSTLVTSMKRKFYSGKKDIKVKRARRREGLKKIKEDDYEEETILDTHS